MSAFRFEDPPMSIESRCTNPECGKRSSVAESVAGKSVTCKACGETFVVSSAKRPTVEDSLHEPARGDKLTPAPGPATSVTLNNRVGRFVIRAKLGAGAFGTVYRAYDPQLDREVALKVPNPGVMTDAKLGERFLREAKAAAGLRHPHIVPVFDAGKDGDQYYIASAFIDGQELADAIPETGTDFGRAARLARELAEALAHAHEQGVVHRDVKPRNVMVDKQDHIHLMDFGLAVRQEVEARLSKAGSVVGTPAYMAPEQARSEEATPASDQYAVGVVLYELLTGEVPFKGPIATVLHNAIHTIPDALRKCRADVPKDLETICLKALSKRPEDRYASCQALSDDLRRWQEGEPITARRLRLPERAARWVRKEPKLASAAATVLLVVGIALLLISSSAQRARDAASDAERDAKAARTAESLARAAESKALASEKRTEAALFQATEANRKAALASDAELGALGTAEEERKKALEWKKKFEMEQANAASEREKAKTAEGKLSEIAARLLIKTAAESFAADRFDEARATLSSVEMKYRNAEWSQLASKVGAPALHTLKGHTNWVNAAAFNRDGTRIVTGSDDETAKVWNAKTSDELHTLKGHTSWVRAVSFNPDGTRIVTGSHDKTAKVWDVNAGSELFTLKGHTDGVYAVAFDGSRVVTGSVDKTARVWNSTAGAKGFALKGHKSGVNAVSFNSDGTFIVTGSSDNTARVWDAATGDMVRELKGHAGKLLAAAFSSDGTFIVTGSSDNTARVWNSKTGDLVRELKGHTNSVTSAAFNRDGTLIVTGSADKTARVWDATTGAEVFRLNGHADSVAAASFSADGTRIVTGSRDNTAKVWDARPFGK